MNILHVNTYDTGGAANACIRLHEGLLTIKIRSKVLFLHASGNIRESATFVLPTKYKRKKTLTQRIQSKIRRLIYHPNIDILEENEIKNAIKQNIPNRIEWFSFPDPNVDITTHPAYEQADILHLHWVADFFNYELLKKIKKPIVWTLHDQNPFTGGCHYSWHCDRYQENCSQCYQLENIVDSTFTGKLFTIKRNALKHKSIHIVTPSLWLQNMSKSSRLFQSFPHHHIPNGLSSSKYISTERQAARLHLNLPLNKRILLFISDAVGTKRKGFSYLLDALKILTLGGDNLLLCSVGSDVNKNLFGELPVQQWGYVQDSEKLSMLYSAADAFIIPSVIDNFPNTVIESLMCGTPVIGFPTGGIVDAIEQGKNGLVCKEVSVKALAKGIKSFFQTQHLFWGQDKIRQEAMNKYDSTVQAKSYIEVYEKLLN